jgi:hypothetical protein
MSNQASQERLPFLPLFIDSTKINRDNWELCRLEFWQLALFAN